MNGRYRSYGRLHPQAHPSDHERGKIAREDALAAKGRQRVERASRLLISEPGDDAAHDELVAELAITERLQRNSKGHKTRLKHLAENPDFV